MACFDAMAAVPCVTGCSSVCNLAVQMEVAQQWLRCWDCAVHIWMIMDVALRLSSALLVGLFGFRGRWAITCNDQEFGGQGAKDTGDDFWGELHSHTLQSLLTHRSANS